MCHERDGGGRFPAHPIDHADPDKAPAPDGLRPSRLASMHLDGTASSFPTRLSAILAADVADYSRHMAEDEAGTHARFMALWRGVIEPGIARFDGQTIKNTGDGFITAFTSATSAVHFAVGLQVAIHAWNRRWARGRSLLFRVGVNVGDVIFEPHDVFGHSVNVAARLEGLAEPGGVLVSHAVRATVRDPALSFEDVGDLSLKNMAETVRGFVVRARRSPAALRQAASPVPRRHSAGVVALR
jgi:class 3 adenylate cyclase